MPQEVDVVVIGAGQAGLATAYALSRRGIAHVVLDAGDGPGGAWAFRWPSLRLSGINGIHDLPGLALRDPEPDRPAADVVSEYFAAYEAAFDLRVVRPVTVTAVRPGPDGRLLVDSGAGSWAARAVVSATGTWTRPFWPILPGQADFGGRQLHTAGYRGPDELRGQDVLVVGGGLSGLQHVLDLAPVARPVWATRRPPLWRDEPWTEQTGRDAVARVERAVAAGRPPASVVSVTGLPVTPQVRALRAAGVLVARPVPARLVGDGAVWPDGSRAHLDTVLWATGFRPALGHLAPLHLREPGGGITMVGTRVAAEPRLHLVGYGPSASTVGASRAGRAAALELRDLLGAQRAA